MELGGRLPSVKGLPDGVRAHLVPRDKTKVDAAARVEPALGTDLLAVLERVLPDRADAPWVLATRHPAQGPGQGDRLRGPGQGLA
ncbi:hypothetical protein AB0L00_22575 [Actinoallomurus sp. NPDC052308]|uniref:hypothetical protein n=1 Tax=Actinoallomurus sp. NPDC052308 TaxID=3155530 RepID=UPI00342BABDE